MYVVNLRFTYNHFAKCQIVYRKLVVTDRLFMCIQWFNYYRLYITTTSYTCNYIRISGSNSVPAPVEGVVNLSSKKSKDKIGGGICEDDKRRTTQLVSHYREGRQIHALKEPRSLFARPNKHTVAERLPLW